MNNIILKYINRNLQKIDSDEKKNVFLDLKDIENFLSVMIIIKNDLSKENVAMLMNNKDLIKRINLKYDFMDYKTIDLFFELLKSLNEQSPSFSVGNFKFILKIVEMLHKAEEKLYSVYDILDERFKQLTSDEVEYNKLILETALGNVENQQMVEEEFVDFILNDNYADYNYKIKLLKELNKYNKKIIGSYVILTKEELQQVFKWYGYDIKNQKSLNAISKKYSESVIKDILHTIKKYNMKFTNDILEKILILGTSVETLTKAYERLYKDEKFNLASAYGIYNFWINAPYKASLFENVSSSVVKTIDESQKNLDEETISSELPDEKEIKQSNRNINSSEVFRTAEYLKKFPFYNAEFDMMKKILKIPVEKLQKRENLIGLYGIKASDIEGSMTLYSPYIITMLDQMIELNLHDYILNHLSALSRPQSLPIILYKYEKEGNNKINVKNGNEYLNTSVVEQVGKYKDAVKEAGLVDINLERRDEFDDILAQEGVDKIIPSVFKLPIIKYLEENYRINELQYNIEGFIFSRKKVLRIASSLIQKVDDFDYETLLYVMTYNKIMNKQDAEKIQHCLQNVYTELKNKIK